jgi:hypothetical protein
MWVECFHWIACALLFCGRKAILTFDLSFRRFLVERKGMWSHLYYTWSGISSSLQVQIFMPTVWVIQSTFLESLVSFIIFPASWFGRLLNQSQLQRPILASGYHYRWYQFLEESIILVDFPLNPWWVHCQSPISMSSCTSLIYSYVSANYRND